MDIKMKRLGAMHYTSNGEEDGQDHTYEMVEVPEEIVKEIIVDIFTENYHTSKEASKEIINDFDWWEELADDYEDEIKERINDNYTIDDLRNNADEK